MSGRPLLMAEGLQGSDRSFGDIAVLGDPGLERSGTIEGQQAYGLGLCAHAPKRTESAGRNRLGCEVPHTLEPCPNAANEPSQVNAVELQANRTAAHKDMHLDYGARIREERGPRDWPIGADNKARKRLKHF